MVKLSSNLILLSYNQKEEKYVKFFDTNLRKKDDIFGKVGPFWTLILPYSQFVDLIIGRGCEKLSPNILTSEWTTIRRGRTPCSPWNEWIPLLKVKLRREKMQRAGINQHQISNKTRIINHVEAIEDIDIINVKCKYVCDEWVEECREAERQIPCTTDSEWYFATKSSLPVLVNSVSC